MNFRRKARFSGERLLVATALVLASTGLVLLSGCSANDGGGTASVSPSGSSATVPLIAQPSPTQNPDGTYSAAFFWQHPGATSCTLFGTGPSGPVPASDFNDLPPGSSVNGNVVTVPGTGKAGVNVPAGQYNFTLACNDGKTDHTGPVQIGPTTPGSTTGAVTGSCSASDVAAGNAAPWVNLAPAAGGSVPASASSAFVASVPKSSGVCLGCSVSPNPPAPLVAGDFSDPTHFVTVNIPAGLLSLQAVNGTLNTIPGLSALLGNTGLLAPIISPVENAVTTPLGTALGGVQAIDVMNQAAVDAGTPLTLSAGQAMGFVVNPGQSLLTAAAVQFFSICPLDKTGAPITAACSENVAQPGGTQGGQANPVKLQALNLTSTATPSVFYSYAPPAGTQFYGMQLSVGGVANVNNKTQVLYACVANRPATATQPPASGSSTTPPASGGTTTPPASGSSTPPASGGSTPPPASGGGLSGLLGLIPGLPKLPSLGL